MVRSDPDVVAFRDINPQAPTHILIIPRKHIASVTDLSEDDAEVMGKLFLVAKDLAAEEGVSRTRVPDGGECRVPMRDRPCSISIFISWAAEAWAGLRDEGETARCLR